MGNGAGGIRTPVSVRAWVGVYTFSRSFDLSTTTTIDSLRRTQPQCVLAPAPCGATRERVC